jgi:hypothetical protein
MTCHERKGWEMTRIIGLFALMALAGCVAPSQNALTNASAACAQGYRDACDQVPALNAQVQQENTNNQVGAAAAGVVGGAVVGGALNNCWNCGYGYRGYGYRYGYPYGYRRW